MMHVLTLPAALLVIATALAGCLGASSHPSQPAELADAEPPVEEATELMWDGYLRVGVGDQFAHTSETEPLVAPIAKMGFLLQVPDETTALQLRLTWPAGEPMHLMTHGPKEAGMPTYMSDMDEWPTNGDICFVVPAAGVVPGTWKVMAHGEDDAVDLAFRITATLTGPMGGAILEGVHGHPLGGSMMNMEMLPTETCALVNPD